MGFIFLLDRAWSEPGPWDMGWKWESSECVDLDRVPRDCVPSWMRSSLIAKLQTPP